MAFIHGKGSVTKIGSNSIAAYSNKAELKRSVDSHDTTCFGQSGHVYAAGLTDGTCSVEGIYDSTAMTGPSAIFQPLLGGANQTILFQPEGAGSGKAQRSFSAVITSYTESTAVADMVTWSAELQISGTVDLTVQP